MTSNRRISLIAAAAFALAAACLVTTANAQPFGPGPGGPGGRDQRGPGFGPGMMMGPGMMGQRMMNRMCGPGAAGFSAWRIDRLEQAIKPTEAQRAKFEELKAASTKAAEIMRGACPAEWPRTLIGRLDAQEKRIDAMSQAFKTMRPALEAFYAALTDEQKARLDSDRGRGRFWRWPHRW